MDESAACAPWQSRTWTSAEGLVLHARDYPAAEGPSRLPVICLHGLTRNARDFEMLAPWIAAAKGRRTLAVDVRGRGGSQRDPEANYRLAAYADDLVRLMDALGIASAVLIGTSMGGLITMELARHAPERIHAAVINDVGPQLGPAGLARIADYVGRQVPVASWDDAAAYLRNLNEGALPHYGLKDWQRMARRMFREEQGGAIRADFDPEIVKPFRDAPSSADPWLAWQALAIGRPVLVLRGALSDLLELDVAKRMVAEGSDVTLVEVPAVGHAPMLDEPAAIAAIDTFLDRAA